MSTVFPILYKLTNTGKIQQWEISVDEDENPYYEIVFGQLDGKMQTTRVDILSGKNIGKANETTAYEQAVAEAQALYTKKIERSGYSQSIPANKPLRPMLAKNYNDCKDKVQFPCCVQPKLDGIRMLAIIRDGQVTLLSRQGKVIQSLPHIAEKLKTLPNCILDGEAYSNDDDFLDIISAVKRDKANEKSLRISYHVYDTINNQKYIDRYKLLLQLSPGAFELVPTNIANSHNEIMKWYTVYINSGYEGAIVRNSDSLYKINGRSADLLKVKSFITDEFEIIDVLPGKGKFADQGTFSCKTKDGVVFQVTPKCNTKQKQEYLTNKHSYIGKYLTVQFFEWHTGEDSAPRFPVGIAVRDYE